MSSFGLIEKNMDLSHIFLAVCNGKEFWWYLGYLKRTKVQLSLKCFSKLLDISHFFLVWRQKRRQSQNGIEIIMELVQTILTWLFCCFRPAIKWFLRQTTRLCELQRICYGEAPGAHRTCAVGKSKVWFICNFFPQFFEPPL